MKLIITNADAEHVKNIQENPCTSKFQMSNQRKSKILKPTTKL